MAEASNRMLEPAKTFPQSRASSRSREIPKHSDLIDYDYAVAGHAGTMCDANGALFIKPCTQAEVDFYESARNGEHQGLLEWMPEYLGTLSLTDTNGDARIVPEDPLLAASSPCATGSASNTPVNETIEPIKRSATDPAGTWTPRLKITTDLAVVLENASYGYKHPNIMDAKLGMRLWADDAPLQKRVRFDKIAEETTHKDFGFRVAGMRVFKGSEDSSDLEKDYLVYNKDWGRTEVNKDNVLQMLKKFIFNKAAGIDEDLGKTIAGCFATDIRKVQKVLESEETRMYSSSLLFVFEGDGQTLRDAIEEQRRRATLGDVNDESAAMSESDNEVFVTEKNGVSVPCANLRVDSGICIDEENGDFIDDNDGDGDDDSDLILDWELSSAPRIYSLRLIDFAHATWAPGQGPDQNLLRGVRSLGKLFEDMAE